MLEMYNNLLYVDYILPVIIYTIYNIVQQYSTT